MSLPHTFLGAALVFWVAASWAAPKPHASSEPVMGFAGSAYGSLTARLMRDSLFTYWHGGATAENSGHAEHIHGPDCDHSDDVEHVHAPDCDHSDDVEHVHGPDCDHSDDAQHVHGPDCDHSDHVEHVHGPDCDHSDDVEHMHGPDCDHGAPIEQVASTSFFERGVNALTRLEASRTQRNSPFSITSSHRDYMDNAAKWRLRLACHLDPGDVVLYEILHAQTGLETVRDGADRIPATKAFAERAIRRAFSPNAGLSDSLAGAGAAINQINEALQPDLPEVDTSSIQRNWSILKRTLNQYHRLRVQAVSEGWWNDITEMRREEFDSHAAFLERMGSNLHQHLIGEGIMTEKSPSISPEHTQNF